MTFLQVLMKVRPVIEKGMTNYICLAIRYHITATGDVEAHARRIFNLLHPYDTYEEWVSKNYRAEFNRMRQIPGAFVQGRLQWIDHMIEQELNPKGNKK